MWALLWSCPASNRAKVLAWRVAHGALACGAYLAAKRGRVADQRHRCGELTCVHQSGARSNLTHIFLGCPEYAAARQWFADLWAAISGGPTPPTACAALMLGDQPDAWEHHPLAQDEGAGCSLARLWTALRVTFLFAVWCTHMEGGGGLRGSAGVVQRTVEELQRVMRAQFRVSALQDDTLDALPTRMLTADLKPAKLEDFTEAWAHGDVLCSVEEQPGGGGLSLRVRLSLQHPVPAPMAAGGDPAGAQEADAGGSMDMELSYG
jgi:hypothetical protein